MAITKYRSRPVLWHAQSILMTSSNVKYPHCFLAYDGRKMVVTNKAETTYVFREADIVLFIKGNRVFETAFINLRYWRYS